MLMSTVKGSVERGGYITSLTDPILSLVTLSP